MKKLMLFFSAGCIGALVNSLVIWQFGQLGINQVLQVAIAPHLSSHWLYPRIVWGGLWGLLFILPMQNSKLFLKGAILSVLPTAVQLLVIFPMQTRHDIAGLDLGLLTPLVVLLANLSWGLSTALVLKLNR